MGKFKDEHGKTRIGLFLKNLAPGLLDVAGDLTGIKALNKVSNAISGSTELSEADKEQALALIQLDIENEKEITKRHQADMTSDSWLSKNVRPMALVFLTFLLASVLILDSSLTTFNVDEAYIALLKTLLLTIFIFYFGDRGIQKGILNYKKG